MWTHDNDQDEQQVSTMDTKKMQNAQNTKQSLPRSDDGLQ